MYSCRIYSDVYFAFSPTCITLSSSHPSSMHSSTNASYFVVCGIWRLISKIIQQFQGCNNRCNGFTHYFSNVCSRVDVECPLLQASQLLHGTCCSGVPRLYPNAKSCNHRYLPKSADHYSGHEFCASCTMCTTLLVFRNRT